MTVERQDGGIRRRVDGVGRRVGGVGRRNDGVGRRNDGVGYINFRFKKRPPFLSQFCFSIKLTFCSA